MNRVTILATAVASALFLSGCEGDDGSSGADGADGLNAVVATRALPPGDADCPGGGLALDSGPDTNGDGVLDAGEVTTTSFIECEAAPLLRALHASPDAPDVNIIVNGTTVLTDVPYTVGSGFLPVTETTQVQVEAIIPGGNGIVIDETLPLAFNTEYTVIASGTVGAPIDALVIENPADELVTVGNFRAQVVHAATAAPPVDVYVTAQDADLTASAPVNSAPLSFEDFTDQVEVPAGNYQIRITLANDPATVVFDSGETPLSDGADLLIAAVDNTGPGDSPVQLVVLDGEASSVILDTATPAGALAVHASPDAGNVDILADVATTAEDEGLALAGDVPFTGFCVIETVPAPGSYTLNITEAGDPASVALSFPLEVEPADEAVAIVTGFAASTPEIQAVPLAGDTRSVITETKLRVTHASPSTGNVDIYLLTDGTDFNDDATTPSFAGVPYTADTGILSVEPGTYDVYVTPADDKDTVAIEVQDLPLTGGQVLDIIARDPATDGSEGALPQLIVVDYATAPTCTI